MNINPFDSHIIFDLIDNINHDNYVLVIPNPIAHATFLVTTITIMTKNFVKGKNL
jgi:hypothetical protein